MGVVESALLPPDPSIVVIPLLSDYPAVQYLNTIIRYEDQDLVLATRLIAAVRRSQGHRKEHIADQGDDIARAVDGLMGGV